MIEVYKSKASSGSRDYAAYLHTVGFPAILDFCKPPRPSRYLGGPSGELGEFA